MGIRCDIGLLKPFDGIYRPGSIVSGCIKYAVDKATQFTKVTVSLKGFAIVDITEYQNRRPDYYFKKEVIVDYHTELKADDGQTLTMNIGSGEISFHKKLPMNIPPSLEYSKFYGNEKIFCKITYYIRVKFDRPGLFEQTKRFKMEIPVVSGIRPVLPREPKVYGAKKK